MSNISRLSVALRYYNKKSLHSAPYSSSSFLLKRFQSTLLPTWATLDPDALGVDEKPHHVCNIVGGEWNGVTKNIMEIPNPMDRNSPFICTIPDTSSDELYPFIESMKTVSKSGVHNPLKNIQRYLMYGEISRRAGQALGEPEVQEFFIKTIMKTVPKSYAQAKGEVSRRYTSNTSF